MADIINEFVTIFSLKNKDKSFAAAKKLDNFFKDIKRSAAIAVAEFTALTLGLNAFTSKIEGGLLQTKNFAQGIGVNSTKLQLFRQELVATGGSAGNLDSLLEGLVARGITNKPIAFVKSLSKELQPTKILFRC